MDFLWKEKKPWQLQNSTPVNPQVGFHTPLEWQHFATLQMIYVWSDCK